MNNEELLNIYLEKLRLKCLETLDENDISVIQALKKSIIIIEGEMIGY